MFRRFVNNSCTTFSFLGSTHPSNWLKNWGVKIFRNWELMKKFKYFICHVSPNTILIYLVCTSDWDCPEQKPKCDTTDGTCHKERKGKFEIVQLKSRWQIKLLHAAPSTKNFLHFTVVQFTCSSP